MRLVITGARLGREGEVAKWLDAWSKRRGRPELTILGCARGVDAEARAYVRSARWDHVVVYAHWEALGKLAGSDRNQRMVNLAQSGDTCIALPSERSIGTHDCARRAKARGLTLYVL